MFLGYGAFTLALRGLLPNYAVMDKITDKATASLSISLYSLFITFFRFVFLFFKLDSVKMIKGSHNILLVASIACLVLHYFEYGMAVVFGSTIVMGMAFSSYYPLMLALPSLFGYEVTSSNSSTFFMGYSIGEAVISSIIGYLMALTAPVFLFYSLLVLVIMMKLIFTSVLNQISLSKDQ